MSEQQAEIVAAADLSPLSPAPIPLHTTSPALIPKLQGHAAAQNVPASESPRPSLAPPSAAAMDLETGSAEPSDTIVVAGDYTDESQDETDDSFDAYGEDEEGDEHVKTEPETVNDDYAHTFDSPPGQNEAGEVKPDVSEAAESMNSSSASDSIKRESPSAPTSVLLSTPALELPAALGSSQPPPASSEQAAPESPSGLQSGAPNPAAAPSASSTPASVASPSRASAEPDSEILPDAPASAATAAPEPAPTDKDAGAVDIIQKLVDSITAEAEASAAPSLPPAQAIAVTSPSVSTALNIAPSASLPPKPSNPLPAMPQTHSYQARNSNSLSSPTASQPHGHAGGQRGGYLSSGAPSTANDGFSSLPQHPSYGGAHDQSHPQLPSIQQAWETFLEDEKRYTSEAKWDRFPAGSRLFIGNLSSERLTKREVFDVFHKYGRLAQISMKNAYGFVQYHSVSEAKAAVQDAEGADLAGRKIHLEVSRHQKKKDKTDREHSPDRRGARGERGPDRGGPSNERFEDRNGGWRRDDYRPGRSPSPRRGGRTGFGSRDRELEGYDRRRSRTPPRFGRNGPGSYRTRSPSPQRRGQPDGGLDLPRRYGAAVPDVQFLLLQEVPREFVAWVQRPFNDRGLKTDVMFLSPRFPRDAVVQRQILEGVHAIVELDYNAQLQRRIPIQVFSRLPNDTVRFDQYQNLEPTVAVEIVIREKASHVAPAPSYPHAGYGQPSYPQNAAAAPPAANYGHTYHNGAVAPAPVQPVAPAIDLSRMVGQLDNASLQALLASIQQPSQAAAAYPGAAANHGQAPPPDINAIFANLQSTTANQAIPPAGYVGAANYGANPAYMTPGSATANAGGFGGGDAVDQQVQTILGQLRRVAQ